MTPTPDVPVEVLDSVRRALARLDDAMQALRRARDYSRIESGTGRGLVDRAEFVRRRGESRLSAAAIREDRAALAEFVAVAIENAVDGAAVVRSLRDALKADRRANPSGRYYDCRRIERERQAALWASLPELPRPAIRARWDRRGYDTRGRNPCPVEIPDPYALTPAEHRRQAARVLRAWHVAQVADWRRERDREHMRLALFSRGKQTPGRVTLATVIRAQRAGARMGAGSPAAVRRYHLDARRRRREPAEATADRVEARLAGLPWLVGVEAEDGAVVVLASDLRAARKVVGEGATADGKAVVVRKVAGRTVA